MHARPVVALLLFTACASPRTPRSPRSPPPPATPPPASPPSETQAPPIAPEYPPVVAEEPPPPPPAQVEPRDPKPDPDDVKACAKQGGKLRPVCMMGSMMCVVPFRDAGKPCKDKRDCIGHCRASERTRPTAGQATTGTCQPNNDPCGCHANIVNGRAEPTICVD